jgi:hypothetical protein
VKSVEERLSRRTVRSVEERRVKLRSGEVSRGAVRRRGAEVRDVEALKSAEKWCEEPSA